MGLQAALLLLVLAHGSSAAQSYLGRHDTLQGLLDIMALVPAAVLAVLLRVVKRLSTDPQLLQSLQVAPALRPQGFERSDSVRFRSSPVRIAA